jgi:hypothetical protein
MEISYHDPRLSLPRTEHHVYSVLLKLLIAYFLTCSLTIPFVNRLWLGEIPVLALIHTHPD